MRKDDRKIHLNFESGEQKLDLVIIAIRQEGSILTIFMATNYFFRKQVKKDDNAHDGSGCCLTSNEQFFSYIMARTSYNS
jgi:hypothetical protein